MFIDLAISLV